VKPYRLQPIYQRGAFAFIELHHRHHRRPTGWLFGSSAVDRAGAVVGVIAVGRANARESDDITTAEILRVCVPAGLPGVNGHANSICTLLYSAAWRACRAIGFRRIITYLRIDEPAVTLKALKDQGWKFVANVKGRSWNRPKRGREDKTEVVDRQLWEWRATDTTAGHAGRTEYT
jgi:hypothetical protein